MKKKRSTVDPGFVFAEGSVDGVSSSDRYARYFRVRIEYREPEFEARTAPRAVPFKFSYRIAASSDEQAREDALAEFHETAALSSVGWRREIVSVSVEAVDRSTDAS